MKSIILRVCTFWKKTWKSYGIWKMQIPGLERFWKNKKFWKSHFYFL